jgi:hypothetical protein
MPDNQIDNQAFFIGASRNLGLGQENILFGDFCWMQNIKV